MGMITGQLAMYISGSEYETEAGAAPTRMTTRKVHLPNQRGMLSQRSDQTPHLEVLCVAEESRLGPYIPTHGLRISRCLSKLNITKKTLVVESS